MVSILLSVFLVQLLVYLVNTIGPKTINQVAWQLYTKFTSSHDSAGTSAQRTQVLRLKKELASISAQDEFSKWARVRRQHDAAVTELEKTTSTQTSSRTAFDRTANIARWICTTGLRLLLQFWHSRKPMLWLPSASLPAYVEWILSFPRAPRGSVSMQVWVLACGAAIALIGEAVLALWAMRSVGSGVEKKKMPMAFAASAEKKSAGSAIKTE